MPWKIDHICDPSDPTPQPFVIIKGQSSDGLPLTKIKCNVVPGCREEFMVVGHEMYQEAASNEELNRRPGNGMPPGFVVARSVKPG